jgi:2-dehydropantoate 2-reductase
MRILIIGAGVTGSIYASFLINARTKLEKRLKESVDIKILARGETYKKIKENGLKIRHHIQDIITIDQIPVINSLETKDRYDYILIFLRKNQISGLLPDLSVNSSKNFVFIGNNGTGADDIKNSISPNKLILGFPGVGGVKEGDTICSVHKKKPTITLGAVVSRQGKPAGKLRRIMRISGINAKGCSNMDSWLKYHIALVSPVANAIYFDGGDNITLSRNNDILKVMVRAIKEGYIALRSLNYPVKPAKLMTMMILPEYIIRGKLKKLLSSEMGKLVIDDHCKAAPEEMKEIADEFQLIIRDSSTEKENLQKLYEQKI